MTEFRRVTPDFAVAAQISVDDVARAAQVGFKAIISNRPDNEESGLPSGAEMKAAAERAGLSFHCLPFAGPPPPAVVAETALLLDQIVGPVLAYCRSGRRSVMAWGMAQALSGAMAPAQIIAAAGRAGYDLGPIRDALETLAPPA